MAIRYTTTKTSIENVKLVVYGRSGTGKTRLIETAPDPVIISSEAKCLSIADSGIPVLEIDGVDDLEEAYNLVTKSKKYKKYKTICLDSISDIAETVLIDLKKTAKDPRKAYGEMGELMTEHIKKFCSIKNKHIYAIAKQKLPKESGDLICPSMPGIKMTIDLPYLFDEVFALRILETDEGKSKRVLQTSIDYEYDCKDSSGKLNFHEKLNLTKIFNKIKNRKK